MSHAGYRLSSQAQKDIRKILLWSKTYFGADAATRYKHLLLTAFSEITQDPELIGARAISGFFLYHIRHCRKKAVVEGLIVKKPRHFVVYRRRNDCVEISRILHEEMDAECHLEQDRS